MAMPLDLYLMRHGESESNVRVDADERGDSSWYQDDITVPDPAWRLTAKGRSQARAMGAFLAARQVGFDRYMVSPFTRTRETAALLELPDARWEENRVVRERSWGEISTVPLSVFRESYPGNWRLRNADPLYWRPPAGESIASVAEDRVHNLLDTIARTNDMGSVIVVTHGDFMWACRLVIEDLSDEEFLALQDDDSQRIGNCTLIHYTRSDPATGRTSRRMNWVRLMSPRQLPDGSWDVQVGPWREFHKRQLTNDELLELAKSSPVRHLTEQSAK